jgi:hypothetical protein
MVSFIPAYTAANVLTGSAKMYTQIYNPQSPPVTPVDTLALGALWAAPWTPIGATESGVTFSFKRATDDITIDEQVTPVDKRTKDVNFTMDVELSEDTINSMVLAYGGGGIVTTAAASGVPGVKVLTISSDLTYFAFGFEGINPYGMPRRVVVPISVSTANAKTQYQRAKKQRTYSTSFESLVAPELVVIREITAAALP